MEESIRGVSVHANTRHPSFKLLDHRIYPALYARLCHRAMVMHAQHPPRTLYRRSLRQPKRIDSAPQKSDKNVTVST